MKAVDTGSSTAATEAARLDTPQKFLGAPTRSKTFIASGSSESRGIGPEQLSLPSTPSPLRRKWTR
jgi:hypothetical protein